MKLTFKDGIPQLDLSGYKLAGWDTNNMPFNYYNQKAIVFDNNQKDSRIEMELYSLIKDLGINDFEKENIEFIISQIHTTKKPQPLEIIPFPFYDIIIGINCENFIIRFRSIQEPNVYSEDWDKKWTNEFYFDQLYKILNNETGVDLRYKKDSDFMALNIGITSNKKTIDLAIKDCVSKFKELLKKVELSIQGLDGFLVAIELWNNNKTQKSEVYWQNVFKKYSWILSLAINEPTVIFDKEAFIGGKSLDNKNGNIIDFVYKNRLSESCALIEIKTPQTNLLGKKYRGIYSISTECTGALNQLLNYKESFQKDFYSLVYNSTNSFDLICPRCYLIIGNQEKMDKIEKKSFELFRKNLSNVTILSYDELFEKIFFVLSIIEKD